MLSRAMLSSACAASLFVASAARADVASPGERIVPSEAVFTGLADFPAYRFVVAVIAPPAASGAPLDKDLPPPATVRDGEPVSTSTVYFQQLWAIPRDASTPVTDAWLEASKAPRSGSFTLHPRRVLATSQERLARARYHVRRIEAGWVALELLSSEAVMADGSAHPVLKAIPQSHEIATLQAPPGWKLFLMPDPAWPRDDRSPPAIPCAAGEVLPPSPGIRTLVAIREAPGTGTDGSVGGEPHLSWRVPLHAWRRTEVPADSPVVAHRVKLDIVVEPGRPLGVSRSDLYQDAQGRWFHDEAASLPAALPSRSRWWAAVVGGLAALAVGALVVRRRAMPKAR